MASADFSTWLTKQQAADRLGVSTKTVEQFAKDRKLEQAVWRRPDGGPALAVFCPDDVDRIASARRGEAVPFVLPAIPTSNGNGHGAPALATASAPDLDVRRALAAGLAEFAAALQSLTAQSSQTSQSSQKSANPFLTVAEAAAEARVSERLIRRWMRTGKLPFEREPRSQWTAEDRGWRIRRKDLEAL